MTNYRLTGQTLNGNYIAAPRHSCAKIDVPTNDRVTVAVDGVEYDRAVYARIVWRNGGADDVLARFVIVNGVNYEVETAPTRSTYQRYQLEAFLDNPDEYDVDAIECSVSDRWDTITPTELADICMQYHL